MTSPADAPPADAPPADALTAVPAAVAAPAPHARHAPGDPGFEERYRAIDARDTRFDGQFVTAVSSTGIYCRPSCPARTPRREHVTFYRTSAAAHEAGYRACKRCLPEATPGTPEWDLRRDAVGRAMRLIGDGLLDRGGVDALAAELGYTPRHVHRMLVAELGAGPQALARARRAQTARALLVGTALPVTDVAFAAGFGSVRQFNDTIREVFAVRPSELRARARRADAAGASVAPAAGPGPAAAGAGAGAPQVRLDLALPVRQPFDARGVLGFLAVRAVAGVEVADLPPDGPLRYGRTLALPHGPGAVEVVATPDRGGWRLSARLELASLADVGTAVARVRRLLDLDADPAAVDAALSADPVLAPLVAATPGTRVPGTVDPAELVVRAIVGQQISVAAARGHLGRLAAAAGAPYASGVPGLDRLFPTPEEVLAAVPAPVPGADPDPARPLRLPARQVAAVLAAAGALADGTLPAHVGADPAELRARLVALPGVGPWTAAYVAMRVLGDPDAWLTGDVALVAGALASGALKSGLPRPAAHRALAERAAAWSPWRSYAAMHLWRAAAAR
ncbi:AlkA N-terminal domain-containing protein [Cellulomonas sp. IC4_254]|uniref:AlkA N-terminal domain-containing protein n=1 Tax=Cellulomonas sp. IC4_254 TaxID=2714040 RepID=UPI00141D90F7|nr:AlkA N-terminal domain-containing protein [Cellulomonas sp. IC4_254]NHT17240.1 DNA-3-methyladenine glycosylase 2 family protein [Cellulomonas sp. IC4_254]